MNCMKRHPVAPEVWSYNADGAPIDHKVVRCLFCKANEEHKYVGDLDGYADPDETLVAVKCGDCNAHFEIPTSNWNSMARFRFEGDNYDTIAHVSNMEYKVYD